MPAIEARVLRDSMGEALRNTDVFLNLCKSTKTDLCPSLDTLCQGQDGEACQRLAQLCKKGGMQLRSNVCLQADGHLCDAASQICKSAKLAGPSAGVCAVLTGLCAAK